jgi:hypothetical protein
MTGLNWAKSIAFVAIFCLLFSGASWFFRPGTGGITSQIQREVPFTIDVLFVGSSHIFAGINPSVLWLDKGIAAFNYTSANQPLWNSYNYIIETLKTQSPAIIVLDVFYVYRYYENGYAPNQQYIFWTFPFSANKINMVNTSVKPEERVSGLIDLLFFHTRWRDINIDSLPYTGRAYAEKSNFRYKGYWVNEGFTAIGDIPATYNSFVYPSTTDTGELHEKNLLYLVNIIELTKEKDIEFILIKTPTAMPFENENEQKAYNTVGEIAVAYQIPFIDFNKDEHREAMGFDFATDAYDNNHLNASGAEKLSKYIAAYLKANYDLPDRRGNPAYSSWDEAAEGYFAHEAAARADMEASIMEADSH